MHWINDAVIYNIYPLGCCGAPKENDFKQEYRLDRISGSGINGASDLGPLPAQSIALLAAIVAAWICIGIAAFFKYVKKPRSGN